MTVLSMSMDQITAKTQNPKGRLFYKIDLLRDLAAGVYLSEAHCPPWFMFGVLKEFCRFGTGQIHCACSVDALHTTQPDPIPPAHPPPPLHTV